MRVSEIYLSVQGEGPRVGTPTVFIRFAGCNLRCPGWPCDTQHAIQPTLFMKDSRIMTPGEITIEAAGLVAQFDISEAGFCLTGGEPFIQKTTDIIDLVDLLDTHGPVECFSNGTLLYPSTAGKLKYIMDWKLPGSGEADIGTGIRVRNLQDRLSSGDSIKFTIKDRADYLYAKELWIKYRETINAHDVNVYYGVVWGAMESSELVGWVLEDGLPWKMNVQVHNYVWDRDQRGI